jgi:GNAT superfamily N-acetyltransferase
MPLPIQYNIRFATEDDVSVILYLVKKLAVYEKLSQEVTASIDLFHENGFGNEPYFKCLLVDGGVKADPRYLGFAIYFFTFSTFKAKPTLYLEDLFVLPEFRGFGIGKSLLIRLAEIAREKQCSRMEWAVLDWNEPAIEFYKGIGAKPMDDWTVFRLDERAIHNLVKNIK